MANDTPTYPQYTNLALGEGLFDQLMAAVKAHLDVQYKDGRIRGDLYARTYLGSLESAMGNATQYLLGVLLIEQKKEKLEAETDLIIEQTRNLVYQTDFLLPKQVEKLTAEIALINKQIEKMDKEIEYLTQKILTEMANVDATAAGVILNSVVGRQVELLRAQHLGFAGDIEIKVAKMHSDYAQIWQTVQETPDNANLNQDAKVAMQYALDTAEKIKNEGYTDPEVPTPVFPEPEIP